MWSSLPEFNIAVRIAAEPSLGIPAGPIFSEMPSTEHWSGVKTCAQVTVGDAGTPGSCGHLIGGWSGSGFRLGDWYVRHTKGGASEVASERYGWVRFDGDGAFDPTGWPGGDGTGCALGGGEGGCHCATQHGRMLSDTGSHRVGGRGSAGRRSVGILTVRAPDLRSVIHGSASRDAGEPKVAP